MAVCTPGDVPSIITRYLGFLCENANPVVTFRNPTELANWTLPVLELTIIIGAVLALIHAIRRLRRDGDPTNLAIWIGSLVYLFVIEPPLYFPEWFHAEEAMGFMFSHNVFTVNFMFDRLPLYIVAFYPALSALVYEIVRSWGFFDGSKRGTLRGAFVVALVFQAFYEIFDQLGPQLKWWAWNVDDAYYRPTIEALQAQGVTVDKLGNPAAVPTLASVPWGSVWLFATVSFAVLIYLAVRLVQNPTLAGNRPRGWSLVWRIVVAGVVAVISMPVLSIPTAVFGRGADANQDAQTVVYIVELVVVWVIGLALLYGQWRRLRAQPSLGDEPIEQLATVGVEIARRLAVLGIVEHLREAGHLLDRSDRDTVIGNGFRGRTGGDQADAGVVQTASQVHQPGLVVDADQRPADRSFGSHRYSLSVFPAQPARCRVRGADPGVPSVATHAATTDRGDHIHQQSPFDGLDPFVQRRLVVVIADAVYAFPTLLLAIVAGVLFVLPKTLYAVTLTEDTGGNNFGCKWWPQEKVLN